MNVENDLDLDILFWHLSYDIKIAFPNATADTDIDWGDTLSCIIEYYYQDSDSVQHYYTTNLWFNSAAVPNFAPINGINNTVSFSPATSPTTAVPYISSSATVCTLHSGGAYNFDFPLAYSDNSSLGILLPDKGSVPVLRDNQTGNLLYSGRMTTVHYTTSQSLHNRLPDVPYMPISGESMSYNDLRQYAVDAYNEINPDFPITIYDLPDFDANINPSGESFYLDYDEILGERELESILKETQYTLDTSPAFDIQYPSIGSEIESMGVSYPSSTVQNSVSELFSIAGRLPADYIALASALALFSVLIWWLTKST